MRTAYSFGDTGLSEAFNLTITETVYHRLQLKTVTSKQQRLFWSVTYSVSLTSIQQGAAVIVLL